VIELKKGDWPRTTEKGVEVYEREELEQFFKACNPDERLLFQTFLCTGFRARELSTLCWGDVDFKRLTITVRPKPAYGFTPKSYEERSVSVPAALINTLKGHYKTHTGSTLVFPTRPHPKRPNYGGEAPDAHHLELCKEIAYRAKLNCGRCKTAKGACVKGPHCAEWYLHKWRHTFATNMIQSGVDIKTLQILLGHKNIATTEKYLKGLRIADLQQKIENSSLAAMLT
jgi:integrase